MTEPRGRELAKALLDRVTFTSFDSDRKWFRIAAREIERLVDEIESLQKDISDQLTLKRD